MAGLSSTQRSTIAESSASTTKGDVINIEENMNKIKENELKEQVRELEERKIRLE